MLLVKPANRTEGGVVRFPIHAEWSDEPDLPFDLIVDIDVDPNDVLVVRQVAYRARPGGQAVTPIAVRRVKLADYVDRTIEACTRKVTTDERTGGPKMGWLEFAAAFGSWDKAPNAIPPFGDTADSNAIRLASRGRKMSRPPLDDELFAEVAEIYRAAIADGQPTRKAVQEHFVVGSSAAGRYVVEARKRGFLGPAIGKKAGERK